MADAEIWAKVYGVEWKMRLRLVRNATYLLNLRSPEPEVLALCRALVKVYHPRAFWDIGACVGYYGMLFKALDPSVGVLMFEPDPVNLDLIHQTVRGAGLAGIHVFPCAVAETEGEALFAPDPFSGACGSLETSRVPSAELLTVKTVTVDGVAAMLGQRADVVKIDVEGQEERVVQGAWETLARDLPVVIFECFHRGPCIHGRLAGLGYTILDADGVRGKALAAGNFLALPPGRVGSAEELRALWRSEWEALWS